MKRTEEEQLYNLLMEQRSAEAPLGRDPYLFTQMAPEARLGWARLATRLADVCVGMKVC